MTTGQDDGNRPATSRADAIAESRVASFSQFYRDQQPSLIAFVLYLGAGMDDAKEVAQEAMTAAWRLWDTIESPRKWSRTTASRMWIRRAVSPEHPSDDDMAAAMPPSRADAVEAAILESHETTEVLSVLRSLPIRQRQVLAWTLDGYAPSEIAEILMIESTAVRTSLKRARQRVAQIVSGVELKGARGD